ncbi:ABC transporter ATP-binding protein [Vibrio sp. AK197]
MSSRFSLLPPVLEVKDLSLTIQGHSLVNDINFSLSAGERVCLIGASGSGKSLTARAISGVLPWYCQRSGTIKVNGQEVSHKPVLARPSTARVATIFQDSFSALNPLMPVGKQLALSVNAGSERALYQLLEQMELDNIEQMMNRLPSELSGGQRQRICIAFALLSGANILIADEPTTALDVINQQQVVKLLKQCSGHHCSHNEQLHGNPLALLFITHDISVAAQLCERALVMENGRIVESATMAQLLSAPQHPYTQQLVHAAYQTNTARVTQPPFQNVANG